MLCVPTADAGGQHCVRAQQWRVHGIPDIRGGATTARSRGGVCRLCRNWQVICFLPQEVEPELEQLEPREATPTLPVLQAQPGESPPLRHTPSHTLSSSPAVGRKKILFTPSKTKGQRSKVKSLLTAQSGPSAASGHTGGGREEAEVYNDPSFIFLQLYHSPLVSSPLTADQPLLLPSGEVCACVYGSAQWRGVWLCVWQCMAMPVSSPDHG